MAKKSKRCVEANFQEWHQTQAEILRSCIHAGWSVGLNSNIPNLNLRDNETDSNLAKQQATQLCSYLQKLN